MYTKFHANFPPYKSDIKEKFGYLSFNVLLINVDLVGVKILKNEEVVVILYRGALKIGFIYEGEKIKKKHLDRIYNDVPDNWNDLPSYEKKFGDFIELLAPPKDNYVFINDNEVVKKQIS